MSQSSWGDPRESPEFPFCRSVECGTLATLVPRSRELGFRLCHVGQHLIPAGDRAPPRRADSTGYIGIVASRGRHLITTQCIIKPNAFLLNPIVAGARSAPIAHGRFGAKRFRIAAVAPILAIARRPRTSANKRDSD